MSEAVGTLFQDCTSSVNYRKFKPKDCTRKEFLKYGSIGQSKVGSNKSPGNFFRCETVEILSDLNTFRVGQSKVRENNKKSRGTFSL